MWTKIDSDDDKGDYESEEDEEPEYKDGQQERDEEEGNDSNDSEKEEVSVEDEGQKHEGDYVYRLVIQHVRKKFKTSSYDQGVREALEVSISTLFLY